MKNVIYTFAILLLTFSVSLSAQDTYVEDEADTLTKQEPRITHRDVLDSLKRFVNTRSAIGLMGGTTINDNSDAFGEGNTSFGFFLGTISTTRLEFENIIDVDQSHLGINFTDFIGESGNKFSLFSVELSDVAGKSWELSKDHLLGFYVGGAITWTNIDLENPYLGSFNEGEARISAEDDDYLATNFGDTYKWGITYSVAESINFNAGWESNHVLHHFLPYKYILSRMLYALGHEIIKGTSSTIFGVNYFTPVVDFVLRGAYYLLLDNINKKEMYGPYSGSPSFHFNQFKFAVSYSL